LRCERDVVKFTPAELRIFPLLHEVPAVAPPSALEPLARFESYGPQAREAALDYFGRSIKEIENILGKHSPDEDLRNDLTLTLWKYARGKAGQDGSLLESPSQVRRYIESLDESARQLRDALVKLDIGDDAAAATVAIMLGAADIDRCKVLGQLEAILSVTENADKSAGGRPPDVEYGLLMDRVIGIFQPATGRRATVTWDSVEHIYTGKFFRIAELVDIAAASATHGRPRTNGALGAWLRRMPRTRFTKKSAPVRKRGKRAKRG
jgi:hypothetical protein